MLRFMQTATPTIIACDDDDDLVDNMTNLTNVTNITNITGYKYEEVGNLTWIFPVSC